MIPVWLFSKPALYAGVLLCAAAAGAGLYWKGKTEGEARGEAMASAALRERDAAIASLEASQKASEGYASELEELRNRPRPDPVIRVCPKPTVPVPGTAPRIDGPAAPAGDVQGQPGQDSRDIGPDLAREADRADRLAAQLRALQEWISQVSK